MPSLESRELSDAERFPLVSTAGLRFLGELREHAHAPRWSFRCGDRLDARGLAEVRAFEARIEAEDPGFGPGAPPAWLEEFAARALATVPIYRRRGGRAAAFEALPTVTRADLFREPWSFVPDGLALDDMITYYTSGTSGKPMYVLAHPVVASFRLAMFRKLLGRRGLGLAGGAGRVAIAFVCSQATTLTYPSVSAYLGEAAHVKVNLNPAEWRAPDDRARFLEACAPELVTGDPLSLLDLARLEVGLRPRAIVSTALTLLPELRALLEARFACPVLDLYSTCESGPIGCARGERFELFLPDLYVETLRPDGSPAGPGERGEIALTGGRNPYLPLLRYRTGDWAALDFEAAVPALTGLEGRAPVVFLAPDGRRINNIDLTTIFRRFPLTRFAVHQRRDRSLGVRVSGAERAHAEIEAALAGLFGPGQAIEVADLPDDGTKTVPYSSELDDPALEPART